MRSMFNCQTLTLHHTNYFKNNSAEKPGDFSNELSEKRVRYSNEKCLSNVEDSTKKRLVASASAVSVVCAVTHVAITFSGDVSVCGLMI